MQALNAHPNKILGVMANNPIKNPIKYDKNYKEILK